MIDLIGMLHGCLDSCGIANIPPDELEPAIAL
jgi:hypothetical protein